MQRDDFFEWPDRAAYGGTWLVMPLFMSSHYPGIERHFAENQLRAPETTRLLRAIPGVTAAVFSWQEPYCHIYAHRDAKAIEVLRAHLALEVPDGARMRIERDIVTWQEGTCLLFDGFLDHETGNDSPHRRVLLMVDACLNGAEFERLQSWRHANGLVPEPKLVLQHAFTRRTLA
ncbi:MAG: aspartyl/asparaginyl beta-hydroxylase domain-containing protein [Planctomycetes bacterium]|nr:aspartyl/asparaginyl beta-hydroxylase domain-containing protein [Planctomycetota bacterium]